MILGAYIVHVNRKVRELSEEIQAALRSTESGPWTSQMPAEAVQAALGDLARLRNDLDELQRRIDYDLSKLEL